MAISRVTTWSAGQVLTASALNAEFNNILNNAVSLISPLTGTLNANGMDLTNIDELAFTDAAAVVATMGALRRNATALQWATSSNHTNATANALTLSTTTSGTPAAGIGTRVTVQSESEDESPSDFGALEFAASDVGTGSEDTYLQVLARVAGAALAATYRFAATAANKAIFTHANTGDRTYTLPDSNLTLIGVESNNAVKGWVCTGGGGSPSITDSYNVFSVTDTATGQLTVTWDVDFANNGYACSVVTSGDGRYPNVGTKQTGSVIAVAFAQDGSAGDPAVGYDVIAIGDR